MPTSLQSHWRQEAPRTYRVQLVPDGRPAADIIDDLLTPDEDWWKRAWLLCDHVVSALLIEALLFGKRRRDGNDNTFNNIVTDHSDGYVSLYAYPGAGDINQLMADDDEPFFRNVSQPAADLEIGDHIIFWNNFIYNRITSGDWRLEHSLVTDVDSIPRGGGVVVDRIRLQGHGTGERRYPDYQDVIASKLRPAMELIQDEVRRRIQANSSVTEIEWNAGWRTTRLVRWSPYETFTSVRNWPRRQTPRFIDLGAWWIEIPLSHGGWSDLEEAVQAMPKSVAYLSHVFSDNEIVFSYIGTNDMPQIRKLTVLSGNTPSPDTDMVYFPIFEPRLNHNDYTGWAAYFDRRHSGTFSPPALHPLRIDGQIMPGIFPRGRAQPIDIVKPHTEP